MSRYLVVLKEETDLEFLKEYKAENIEVHMGVIIIADIPKEESLRLKDNPLVESVEEDNVEHMDIEETNDNYISAKTSYAYDFMNIEEFHKRGYTGKGFKIGILDTGVQKHTNLKVTEGVNVYDSTKPWDYNLANNHGTMVTGVVNAQGINGELIGIAPDAELYAIRIDNGNGAINSTTWSSQIAGISWAMEKGIDAVNCSFSSWIESKARKRAFKIASDNGMAIFCSAGNNQPRTDTTTNTSKYPAKYPFTYGNANITKDKVRYPTSCIGQGLNFSNGGSSVLLTTADRNSTEISSNYRNGTGTSMASPATLGIYILYKQMYNEPKEKIIQRMAVNAEPLGDTFWYGAGLPKFPTIDYVNVNINNRR